MPELWDWDRYHDRGYKQVVFSEVPCNWLQCQENSIDPVHFEWLHSNQSLRLKGAPDYSPTHTRVGFDEFEFGIRYLRIRSDTDEEDDLWKVGRVCLWPNALYTGHFEWRVPVDDEHTLSVGWFIDPMPGEQPFEQERIPYWYSPIVDEGDGSLDIQPHHEPGLHRVGGAGECVGRWNEHLGESDRGVIMLRKQFMDDLAVIEDGGDPKGILRDASRNDKLPLPRANVRTGLYEQTKYPPVFPFLVDQPEAVAAEYHAAWKEYGGELPS